MARSNTNSSLFKHRTLANTIKQKTPFEIFFEEKPNVKFLKLYGSKVYVRMPEQLRKSKWENKANLVILLGYTEVGYRVLINNKVITARHVKVVEDIDKIISFRDSESIKDNSSEVSENESYQSIESDKTSEKDFESENQVENKMELRRSLRNRKQNSRFYNEDFVTNNVFVSYCDATIPNTIEEALNSNESENWHKAMDKEINSLNEN